MPGLEIEINPVTFVTIGTIGPKGKRQFFLQAGDERQTVSLLIEKEQARRLGEAIVEMLDELSKRTENPLPSDMPDMSRHNMELRDPVESSFRVAQMGLGYDDDQDLIVLVAQELVLTEDPDTPVLSQPSVARFWGARQIFRALALYAQDVVKQGRADPAHNGRVIYYWT